MDPVKLSGPACTALRRGSLRSPLRSERRLVPRAGLEPTTYGLGIRRSVQLSYRCVAVKIPKTRRLCQQRKWPPIRAQARESGMVHGGCLMADADKTDTSDFVQGFKNLVP